MKKKTVGLLISILIIFLLILLGAIFFLKNVDITNINSDKMREIEIELKKSAMLNCIYNTPEEIGIYYIFTSTPNLGQITDDTAYIKIPFSNAKQYLLNNTTISDINAERIIKDSTWYNKEDNCLYINNLPNKVIPSQYDFAIVSGLCVSTNLYTIKYSMNVLNSLRMLYT